MKRVVGYMFDFEIVHKSELDYAKKKRDDHFRKPAEQRPKTAPRAPPSSVRFEDTDWHIVSSKLNKRFTAKQFIMMYLRYDLRKLDFGHIIAKCDKALENVRLMKHTVDGVIYKSKIDLIRCVKHMFVEFVKDVHFNSIKPTGKPNLSLIDYVTEIVKNAMIEISRADVNRLVDPQDENRNVSFNEAEALNDVAQVLMLWQGGTENADKYVGTQSRDYAIITDMIGLLKKANPNFDGSDKSASGSIISQQMHVSVWIQWMGMLNERGEDKRSLVARATINMFMVLGRLAFGHLASLSSNFGLERKGFEKKNKYLNLNNKLSNLLKRTW